MKAETAEGQVLKVLKDLHFSAIRTIKFLPNLDLVISTDDRGMIEIWDPETFGKFILSVNQYKIEFPDNKLSYELASDTDMLELAKSKTFALSCAVSTSGELVALYARDRKIRVFDVRSGKLVRTIDDNAQIYVDY